MGSSNVLKRKLIGRDKFPESLLCFFNGLGVEHIKREWSIGDNVVGAMNFIVCSFYGYLAPQHSSFNAFHPNKAQFTSNSRKKVFL